MIAVRSKRIHLVEDETQSLLAWAEGIQRSDATYFEKAQRLARRLGANYRRDRFTEFGFWTPELAGDIIQSEYKVELEVYTPKDNIDFRAAEQQVRFKRTRVPMAKQGEFVWAVIEGLRPGRRDRAGCFYWLRYVDPEGRVRIIRDPLAYSLPYGVFAPAELYDMHRVQRERQDRAYFRQRGVNKTDSEIPREPTPTNILQIHVKTASPEGTLEGLTQIYQRISDKLVRNESLNPEEAVYAGYDAIQLLPVEPTIEYRREDTNLEHEFFAIALQPPADTSTAPDPTAAEPEASSSAINTERRETESATDAEPNGQPETDNPTLTVHLRKPNTQNRGYDVPILGSGTTNPAVLGSLRPDEIVDFIATLHNFSQGPILLIYDLVYGHADNQSLELLTHQFLKGPNMYGQDLNHQSPQVRAILLEMQRRKINTGADGIRVDGGQDFRFFNPLSDRVEQDDRAVIAIAARPSAGRSSPQQPNQQET